MCIVDIYFCLLGLLPVLAADAEEEAEEEPPPPVLVVGAPPLVGVPLLEGAPVGVISTKLAPPVGAAAVVPPVGSATVVPPVGSATAAKPPPVGASAIGRALSACAVP